MIYCGLEVLLDLHGQILVQEDGSWIKIEAQKVPFDHRHPFEKREPVIYAFSSPEELLRHFFAEVDEVLRELEKR